MSDIIIHFDDSTNLPQSKPELADLAVDSLVTGRYASTTVTSRFENRGVTAAESTYRVRVPKDAFITGFTM